MRKERDERRKKVEIMTREKHRESMKIRMRTEKEKTKEHEQGWWNEKLFSLAVVLFHVFLSITQQGSVFVCVCLCLCEYRLAELISQESRNKD